MENKNEGNENKIALQEFNCTIGKIEGMVEVKHFMSFQLCPVKSHCG